MPDAPAPPEAAAKGTKAVGGALGKQAGPLPVWVWAAAVAGGIGIYVFQQRNAAPAPAEQLTTGDQAEVGAGPGGWYYQPALPVASAAPPATIETNEQWAVEAERYLMNVKNYDPGLVDAAVRRYISGESLSAQQWSIINDALRFLGPLPSPLPPLENNPPSQAPPPVTTKPPAPKPPTTKPGVGYMKVGTWPNWNGSLWGIAKHYYGNGALWPIIYNANRNIIKNPNVIKPGWIIAIPKR
jgi:hypothetical protein